MKNLKLNAVEANKLNEKQMNAVKGGDLCWKCGCACAYRDSGGASIEANKMANDAGGLTSPYIKDALYVTEGHLC